MTKSKQSEISITFLEKLLDKDIDEGALLLDETFSPMGINFIKVDDEKDYKYDENLKKTDILNNYFKYLSTDKDFYFQLIADQDRKINELKINGNLLPDSLIQKIGLQNWIQLETKGETSLYKKGKYFARLNSGKTFDLQVFVPVQLASVENIDSLTIKSSYAEAIGFAKQMMITIGYQLLAAKQQLVYNDSEYNFLRYQQELIYNKGTKVEVEMNDKKKITIDIINPSAIIFGSLKSGIINTQWEERYTNSLNNITYFRKKNMMVKLFTDNNRIRLYAVPDIKDTESKLIYGDFLTLSDLNEIYDGFSYDDRIAYMNDHYLVDKDYANNTFILQTKDYKLRYLLGASDDFKNNWGFKFLVDSDNSNINNYYLNSVENLPLASQNYSIDVKTHGFPNRAQFYNKAFYTANKVSQDAKKNAELLAEQRDKAEQKQRDIIREQEKARKNAELTETINKTTNDLLKLLQK